MHTINIPSLCEECFQAPSCYQPMHCIILHCAVLCCTALYCTVLYCTTLSCNVLYFLSLHFTALHYVVMHFTIIHSLQAALIRSAFSRRGHSGIFTLCSVLSAVFTNKCTVCSFSLHCAVFSVHNLVLGVKYLLCSV